MLLLNKMKKNIIYCLSQKLTLALALTFLSYASVGSELTKIHYNTIQNDEIEIIFTLSDDINSQPDVSTSMNPARIEITFDAENFAKEIESTLV